MAIRREVKVGALALVALAMLLYGISWLRNSSLLSPPMRLYSVYHDVAGLAVGDPVLINGMAVGAVREMVITADGRAVLVGYEVEAKVPIPRDSRAVITSPNLLGGKAITLALGRAAANVAKNDTLRDSLEVSMLTSVGNQVGPIADQVRVLTAQLNRTVAILNSSLDSAQLRRIVSTTAATTSNLAEGSRRLNQVLANTERLTATLAKNEQNLDELLANSAGISDSLRTAMTDLKGTLANANAAMGDLRVVTAKLATGDGTLGKLLSDDQLYANLTQTTADLDALLVDIKERPGRFLSFSVFGKGDRE